MKRILLISILLLTVFSFSQEKINDISTPISPASSILGMQPSSILKPKSYRALEASLFSNFSDSDGNGILPNDFGLEFMPYWAQNRGITLTDYLYPEIGFSQLVKNSSFSIATTQKFMLQDSTETKSIALGYRTSLFFGSNADRQVINTLLATIDNDMLIRTKLLRILDEVPDNYSEVNRGVYIDELKRILPTLIGNEFTNLTRLEVETITQKIYTEVEQLPYDSNNIDVFITGVLDIVKEYAGANYNQFKNYINNRRGLSIDFATALLINFPDNNFNFSEVPKFSLWLTPSYNFANELDFLTTTASLRYERYYKDYFEKYFPDSEIFENNLDYGLAIAGKFKKYSIEFEATGRRSNSLIEVGQDEAGNSLYRKENSDDLQYIGTFSYKVTDQIVVSYQIGSDFKPIFNAGGGNLISLLSLNFGLGGPEKTDVTLPD
jgi:hypothetical protein